MKSQPSLTLCGGGLHGHWDCWALSKCTLWSFLAVTLHCCLYHSNYSYYCNYYYLNSLGRFCNCSLVPSVSVPALPLLITVGISLTGLY